MSQTPLEGSVQVKPQSNVYTLLMIVSILSLSVAIIVVLTNLMMPVKQSGYGLGFGEIISPLKMPK
ncbi:MAG: hypothetical protein QGH94_17080 [Phycisphaerae bacterium]|jgi:hypothetical protein|nr:hypothetical protein [Phycisphaerae bacterium]